MNAYEYAEYVKMCATELRAKLNGVIPLKTYAVVLPRNQIKSDLDWIDHHRPVFCHPDDSRKEYVEDFTYPYREL